MSGFHDDYDDMTDATGGRRGRGGSAAGDDDVTRFLTELRALGTGPAPEPSPELAALLNGSVRILAPRTALRIVLRSAAVAALVIGLLVVAAANHSLPAPAQTVVSDVVNVLTPFHIDRREPTKHGPLLPPASERPSPSRSAQPGSDQPTPPSHRRSEAPPASPTPTDDDRESGRRSGDDGSDDRQGDSRERESEDRGGGDQPSDDRRSGDQGTGEHASGDGGSRDDGSVGDRSGSAGSGDHHGDDGGERGDD